MFAIPSRIIVSNTLGANASDVTLNIGSPSLPFTHRHLLISVNANDVDNAEGTIQFQLNADTGTNYNFQMIDGAVSTASAARTNGASAGVIALMPGTDLASNVFGGGQILIPDAFSTRSHKAWTSLGGSAETRVRAQAGRWANTAAITSVKIIAASGTFRAGSTFELAVVDEMFAVSGAERILAADGILSANGLPVLDGDILVIGNLRSTASADSDNVEIQLNGDVTDGNYAYQRLTGASTTTASAAGSDPRIGVSTADTATASATGAFVGVISNHAEGVNDPQIVAMSGYHADTGDSTAWVGLSRRNNIEGITSLTVNAASGTTYKTNSMLSVYHVPKNVIAYSKLESDASDVTLTIPSGYQHLKITAYARGANAANSDGLAFEFNGDATAGNYDSQLLQGAATTVLASQSAGNSTLMNIPAATQTANVFGGGVVFVPNYANTDRHKHFTSVFGNGVNTTGITSTRWENTAAITSVKIYGAVDDLVAGSVFVVEGIGGANYEDNLVRGTYVIEVDWNNDGKFDGTGEDVTADTTAVEFDRGRASNISITARSVSGRLRIELLNEDGDYSPLNTSSPIYPNVVPGRQVRIRQVAPQIQTIWQGFVDGVELTQSIDGFHRASIRCGGPESQITESEVTFEMQTDVLTGTAISQLLDDAGWDSTARQIDDGQTTMNRYWTGPKQAITAIREVEATENGFFNESKDGKLRFEDRHHRLYPPHTVSQATFSDQVATNPLNYSAIEELDPSKAIYNVFKSDVVLTTTGTANQVLWVHPEASAGTLAPQIPAGGSLTFWANYPNRSDGVNVGQGDYGDSQGIAVHQWSTASATLDYNLFDSSAATGDNLNGSVAVSTSGFANSHVMTITNTGSLDAWLTKMQLRGTPVLLGDPVTVESTNAESITTYGRRTLPRTIGARFIPNTQEAQDWADSRVSVWKDPQGFLRITMPASKNLYSMAAGVRLDISDRITIEGTGAGALGVSGDYYIEAERHRIRSDRMHSVTYAVSPIGVFSGYWVVGVSRLGIDTKAYY